jgi:hypothetical protein
MERTSVATSSGNSLAAENICRACRTQLRSQQRMARDSAWFLIRM